MTQKWNIKSINGTACPVPATLKVAYYTVELDSGVNMQGTMIHNVVNHKQKFFITTPPLDETALATFLGLVKPNDLTIIYYDVFNNNAETTGYFYHGDIVVEPIWIRDINMTDVLYNSVEVNLIEN